MAKTSDRHLLKALTQAYTARALLFHKGVKASQIDLLIAEVDQIAARTLAWDSAVLGISRTAMDKVRKVTSKPHQVFAHPDVIAKYPHLIVYYRNLAISQKGISQILFSTKSFESRKKKSIELSGAKQLCRTLNTIIAGVIENVEGYDVQLSRHAIVAEIGCELQGTWANYLGKNAAKAVKELLRGHCESRRLLVSEAKSTFVLKNGWRVVFGAEPDVTFSDKGGVTRIAIEIKGSLDIRGAQTRYGEAKKTFQKELAKNPRCHTVFLASCFTDAVINYIGPSGFFVGGFCCLEPATPNEPQKNGDE